MFNGTFLLLAKKLFNDTIDKNVLFFKIIMYAIYVHLCSRKFCRCWGGLPNYQIYFLKFDVIFNRSETKLPFVQKKPGNCVG